jgi:cyanophycin synthetase
LPFEDSRRLTGSNLFFATPGAVLELIGIAPDALLCSGWRERVQRARARLAWPAAPLVVRGDARGASFALAAPCDQLFLATEINEWALCATLLEHDASRYGGLEAALRAAALADAADTASVDLPVLEESAAHLRFARLSAREARPDLRALLEAATAHGLPHLLDDTTLTLGAGAGGRSFALSHLPHPASLRWTEFGDIPTVLVTGSNGKTTSVRLLAACARAYGWCDGYNCTDGVFIGEDVLARGDYSGPAGVRLVMRDARTQAAILEVARGGILRRGIAVSRAQVALITNVSSDHFGEYGIYDLPALADVKLSVAGPLTAGGQLVLSADDGLLRAKAGELGRRFGVSPALAWFALDADHPVLRDHRARGGPTCGVRAGHLWLGEHDLGTVAAMPLTVEGLAGYNIANLAGAALAATGIGIPPAVIAAVFAKFGAKLEDNPGRMMRFDLAGVRVLVDYAHNPEGLHGLLQVAQQLRGAGRLGLILGHAGNRQDADIEALARVAAEYRPDFVPVKENEAQLRGRAPGETPRIIRAELLRAGLTESALPLCASELDAVRCALDWARPGDVLALPVHGAGARAAVIALLRGRG